MATDILTNDSVEQSQAFASEFAEGMAVANAYYIAQPKNLIDTMALDVLATWDGADEMALVSDPDGVDLPDDLSKFRAA